jgi:hypothetical protein
MTSHWQRLTFAHVCRWPVRRFPSAFGPGPPFGCGPFTVPQAVVHIVEPASVKTIPPQRLRSGAQLVRVDAAVAVEPIWKDDKVNVI